MCAFVGHPDVTVHDSWSEDLCIDAGGLENLYFHSGNTPMRRSLSLATGGGPDAPAADAVQAEYVQHCRQILQAL